jgi:hypothetical protein
MRSRSRRPATFLHPTFLQDESLFFRLPWELRTHIYTFAFGDRVFVSVAPDLLNLDGPGSKVGHFLHKSCPNGKRRSYENSLIDMEKHWSPFTEWAWPSSSSLAPPEERCDCNLRGCVRLLRTCQRIYLEARGTFFASICYEFDAARFRRFYTRSLCYQFHGFDPVNYVRNLALMRERSPASVSHQTLTTIYARNLTSWSNALAFLKSPRWNLSHLFIEDFQLNILRSNSFNLSRQTFPHSFPLISQLRGIPSISINWRVTYIFTSAKWVYLKSDDSQSTIAGPLKVIYGKALNEITSQPRPTSSKELRRWKRGLTKAETDQIESDFKKRVSELAEKEGLTL